MVAQVRRYLEGVDPHDAPVGTERTVSLKTGTLALTGRIDRLDARGGHLRVVDYKTSRAAPTDDDARTSLPLALYAIAAARMFRATCTRVELHHVPTGSVAVHTHTTESLERKLAEAESIAADLRRADADFAERGPESTRFAPADVGPVHLVRLPRPLPRGPAGRSGEVLLGGARGRERLTRPASTGRRAALRLPPPAATGRAYGPNPDTRCPTSGARMRPVGGRGRREGRHLGPGDLVAAFVCVRGCYAGGRALRRRTGGLGTCGGGGRRDRRPCPRRGRCRCPRWAPARWRSPRARARRRRR